MANKIRAKLVLRLRAAGHSRNAIARSQQMAKRSVCDVCDAADALGITYDDVADMDDDAVYRMLFPNRFHSERIYHEPDWDYVHKELGKTGVTLKILHAEYVDNCLQQNQVYMSYATFCRGYQDFVVSKNITSHVERKAAASIEVDWSGSTMQIVDPITGEITKVHLFVATLPFSRYDYVEPTLDMKQETWFMCHVHMFDYFGGSTPRIVPDNLKASVTKHPKEGEIVLNDSYRELASHYSAAVLPARVSKPKDKPNVEGSVGNIASDIIAELRNTTFSSFEQLKDAVKEKLEEHNNKPFQKREGTRKQCFENQEKPYLQPLPPVAYEVCTWVFGRKVNLNCHIVYKKNFYSCNWSYVGKSVDLRITDTLLEIYSGSERIATHFLFPSYITNRYSTRESDIPKEKVYREWDASRIREWAERIGPATLGCINRIFESVKFDEQGFNAALAILRLSHQYSSKRLEKACSLALKKVPSPRYSHIKPILETNQDKLDSDAFIATQEEGGYVRGAAYYERN